MKTIQYNGPNEHIDRRPIRVRDDVAASMTKGDYRYVPKSLRRFFLKHAATMDAKDLPKKKLK